MRWKFHLAAAGLGLCLASGLGSVASADVTLPNPDCGLTASNNCLIFNQFTVYSLALLNYQAGFGNVSPGDPYYVSSNGMDIANALVIESADANAIKNQDTLPGTADQAYSGPTGGDVNANFLMTPGTTGSGTQNSPINLSGAGDYVAQAQTTIANYMTANATLGTSFTSGTGQLPLWNVSTSALTSYLNGGSLDFFFNLNQTNSAQSYLQSPQDMLAALEVIFTGPAGQITFFLNGDACNGGPVGSCSPAQAFAQQTGVNDILQSSTDEWAYVHGQICVSSAGAVLGFGACDSSNPMEAGGTTVNQNLGANNAAFALYSQGAQNALDCTMSNGMGGTEACYTTMSVDLRMAGENNGFEQLFILPGMFSGTTEVPEPATISIVGAGLVMLGIALQRRQKRARISS